MRNLLLTLGGLFATAALLFAGIVLYEDAVLAPEGEPGPMPRLESKRILNTVNTVRLGSDDPVETAVAVSQAIYPATEPENVPGAVVLVNRNDLAEVLLAPSRVQHFPVNAPLLYVDQNSIPELTRRELLRLEPEGVPMDGNVQVYLVGTIGEEVRRAVAGMGYRTRVFPETDPIELSEALDNWSSTQHGDHKDPVAVANLDELELAIPSAFWNAHAGDALVFVTDEGVPETTKRILERRSDAYMYLFGDEPAIPDRVARELAQYGPVTRMPRGTLPEMSAFFAGFNDSGEDFGAWVVQGARDFGWGNADAGRNAVFVNVDGPGGWQNAIVATTLSHMGKHAPVLAVDRDGVPDSVRSYLEIIRPYETAPQEQLLDHGWIIGGERTISWATQGELDLIIEAYMRAEEARR